MPSEVPIRCMAAYTEEAEQNGGLVPLFVGRDDGTVERFDAMQDAELGIPSVAFFAHRRPVTGLVATSPTELHTCSLDGTMKQWTLSEAAPEGLPGSAAGMGGARIRAALTKTITFPFGVSVMVQENGNRLLLGGEDGSLTLMEGERRSTWRAHDGGAVTAIAVDAEGGSSAVLTGGADGVIVIWDMEFGRPVCELRGHTGPIRALAFVPVPAAVPVVRQKRVGDTAEVKEVLVHGNPDEGTGATCIVSCAADGTAKVWLLPDLHEANAEAELLERRQQQQLQELESAMGAQRRSIGISFQEPKVVVSVAEASTTADDDTSGGEAAVGHGNEAEEAASGEKDGPGGASATRGVAEAEASTAAATTASAPELDAKEQFLRQQVNAAAFKSAIKPPERRLVPSQAALGTVELPQVPLSCTAPSSSPAGAAADGEGGGGGTSLLFLGAAHGDVYGLRTRRLVKEVCLHAAQNFQKVQQAVAQVQKTLRDGTRVYTKEAAAKMKAEETAQLAVAAKARRAKAAAEKAARREAAEARRAARRRAAAEAEDDEDGDGEEGQEEEEEEQEEMEEEDEAEDPFEQHEEGEEEEGDEGVAAEDEEAEADGEEAQPHSGVAANAQKPRRPASWKKLSPEQRAALEAFCTTQEAERDKRIAALRTAVEAHVAQVQPLAKTVYHRSRAQFANLSHTTSGHIHNGTAVTAVAAASLVAAYADKVYAAQVNAVVPVTVAIGLVKL